MPTRQHPPTEWNWGWVRSQCLREAQQILGPTSEAEDAAQEAAVRAWLKRHACEAPERPGPWLRTIARREALRVAVRRREAPLEAAYEAAAVCDEERVLLRRTVRAAVAALPAEDRRLLLGAYWHDLSGAELSRRLGRAEATVRVQLHRTRGRLREVLEPTI